MKCKFEVGQKVVCISTSWWDQSNKKRKINFPVPSKGEIVTVSEIAPDGIYVWLQLKEYSSPVNGEIPQFYHEEFRPLNERPSETSIEVFKKFLTPTDKLAKEKV